MDLLVTRRLVLEPMTLPIVEGTFAGDRAAVESILGARFPEKWPGRTLIERAFCASLSDIRADPETRLWGDRLMIVRAEEPPHDRLVVGSVVFRGRPNDGEAEVGYGVDERWQRHGYASEATDACAAWALEQPGVSRVSATTPPWHQASIRVLERSGFCRIGTESHEVFGEVLRFARSKS